LQENKYEYKLEKDKRTILVPKESIHEIRRALARNGLPNKNFVITDPPSISIAEYLPNKEWLQESERELARTIEAFFREVEKAMVSINKDTTATVRVKLHPNEKLQEKQIKQIQHLVASAAEELKAERVSVIDDKGNNLTETEFFTDPRDGKTYKTIKIGEQIWMAENLNYEAEGSRCYNDSTAYCEKYGRLYDWNIAMQICPDGWHLPTNGEWDALVAAIGGSSTAARYLKATNGWNDCGKGNSYKFQCEDKYNFAALPGGGGNLGDFSKVGEYGFWWSASGGNEDYSNGAYRRDIDYSHESINKFYSSKSKFFFSVRCVRD